MNYKMKNAERHSANVPEYAKEMLHIRFKEQKKAKYLETYVT